MGAREARARTTLARLLQRSSKPLFLAVNKAEGEAVTTEAENFRMGIREVYPVSQSTDWESVSCWMQLPWRCVLPEPAATESGEARTHPLTKAKRPTIQRGCIGEFEQHDFGDHRQAEGATDSAECATGTEQSFRRLRVPRAMLWTKSLNLRAARFALWTRRVFGARARRS